MQCLCAHVLQKLCRQGKAATARYCTPRQIEHSHSFADVSVASSANASRVCLESSDAVSRVFLFCVVMPSVSPVVGDCS